MSQANKIIIAAVIAALIGSGGTYLLLQQNQAPNSSPVIAQEKKSNKPDDTAKFAGAVKYNCEKSGGSYSNNSCTCPVEKELGQTQDMMYDKNTGYCQTTDGGPAGDAFAASAGLPYGDYSFYNDIIQNNCRETGGEFLYTCNCPNGKTYSKSTGYCK